MTPFLDIRSLSKTFRSEDGRTETPVVTEMSMQIATGEIVMFLGPSGCGKTTLMRIIGGLEQQSTGEVFLRGARLGSPDRRRGMVFQSYSSFPWLTVRENIAFGLRYRSDVSAAGKREITAHYLDLVGLTRFADYYTNRISGGMRQRVAIARTLAADPDLLLMDEPFGALDALTREFLQIQLLSINAREHKTTIFVTHDVEEAVLMAHRIVIFSARPARVIEEIDVAAALPLEDRATGAKESEAFFALRNRILKILRDEHRRTAETEGDAA